MSPPPPPKPVPTHRLSTPSSPSGSARSPSPTLNSADLTFTSLPLDEVNEVLLDLSHKEIELQDQYKLLTERHQAQLSAFRSGVAEFRSTKNNKKSELDSIQSEFFTGKDPIRAKVNEAIHDQTLRSQRLSDLQECRLLLDQAHSIHTLLQQASQHVQTTNYHPAAINLKQARSKALSALTVHGDLLVYRDAKYTVDARINAFGDRLSAAFDRLVARHINNDVTKAINLEIRVDPANLPASTHPIVDILNAYNELVTIPSLVTERFNLPVTQYPMIVNRLPVPESRLVISFRPSPHALEPEKAIANVFTYANLLTKELNFPSAFTNLVVSPLLMLIKTNVLEPRIPIGNDDHTMFRQLVHQARQLETKLMAQNVISSNYAHGGQLAEWDIDTAVSNRANALFIDRARTILYSCTDLNKDPGTPIEPLVPFEITSKVTGCIMNTPATRDPPVALAKSAKEPLLGRPDPFRLPAHLKIPSNVFRLINEIVLAVSYTDLDERGQLQNQLAGVIDLYLMYTSTTMHHYHRPSARAMALIHNGAVYLSDILVRLSLVVYPWCVHWTDTCFASRVPKLVQVSKSVVRTQVSIGKADIVRLMAPLDRLWGDIGRYRDRIQEILVSVVMRIKAETDLIQDVTVECIRYYWIGMTYDVALHSVLNEVYTWKDITATESDELHSILQTLLIPAHHFLGRCVKEAVTPKTEIGPDVSSTSGNPHPPVSVAGAWVPHYAEFAAITQLLHLPLKSIMEQYRSRHYEMVTIDHLKQLIVALFRDSTVRQSALTEVTNSGVRLGLVLPQRLD